MSPTRTPTTVPPITREESSDTGCAMAVHLVSLCTGWIGALAFTLATGRSATFVRQHARQAMNFQLNGVVAGITILLLARSISAFGLLGLVLFIAYPVLAISATVRAARGDWTPYPRLIPFLRSLPEPMGAQD